ncbi:MAG: patatin-like phospholipase family protein [Woeseiaceae bacterium]|nr:patatin-like phospholipase family protein [Woeseiaceae bacterium]
MSRTLVDASLAVLAIAVMGLVVLAPADSRAAAAERPRIGLVLGGGGARGAAHIGVLRELERLRVPVDAIAGTGVGAIVGGLYASGKTPTELEEIVASLDWQESFRDRTDRRDLPFRRKQDDADYPIRFELGVRDGTLQLPKGLVHGQELGQILRELTRSTAGITDFDELPIPFRAGRRWTSKPGEPYVVGAGDLPRVLRASMSAPGIFAPVIVDGHTLVDGGLTGNVPVEAVRTMGVDLVIAVDVEFPLYPPGELDSAVAITGQMLTILDPQGNTPATAGAERGEETYLVRPDLGSVGLDRLPASMMSTIEPGAAATRAMESRLARLSLDEAAWQHYLGERRHRWERMPPWQRRWTSCAWTIRVRCRRAYLNRTWIGRRVTCWIRRHWRTMPTAFSTWICTSRSVTGSSRRAGRPASSSRHTRKAGDRITCDSALRWRTTSRAPRRSICRRG